jgi:hypothetical protein
MALSFYPRLKLSTQVSERHAMLIFEKILGGNFKKIILEEELYELDNGVVNRYSRWIDTIAIYIQRKTSWLA